MSMGVLSPLCCLHLDCVNYPECTVHPGNQIVGNSRLLFLFLLLLLTLFPTQCYNRVTYNGMCICNIDGWEGFDHSADQEVHEGQVAQQHVVGGGLQSWQVLQGDEGNIVEQGAHNTEPHLGGYQEGDLLSHPLLHPRERSGPNWVVRSPYLAGPTTGTYQKNLHRPLNWRTKGPWWR